MRSWVGPTYSPPISVMWPPASGALSRRPPTRSRASRTTTEWPFFFRARAAASPEMPAPTTTTSTVLTRLAKATEGRLATAAPAAAPSSRRRRVMSGGVGMLRASCHERQVVRPNRARRALTTDDGPRHRGDRRGRSRPRTRAVRGDEARVADAPRPDGRVDPRADLVRAGQARRRGRRRGVGADGRAGLAPTPRRDQPPGPAGGRRAAGRDVARPLRLGRRRPPRQLHDYRGRREGDVHHESVRLRPAARAQGPLRVRRLRAHARGPRLVLRARGLPALLHPLFVHEREAPDRVERFPALSVGPARGLLHRSVHVVLVQGPSGHPRPPLGALRGGPEWALIACAVRWSRGRRAGSAPPSRSGCATTGSAS